MQINSFPLRAMALKQVVNKAQSKKKKKRTTRNSSIARYSLHSNDAHCVLEEEGIPGKNSSIF